MADWLVCCVGVRLQICVLVVSVVGCCVYCVVWPVYVLLIDL